MIELARPARFPDTIEPGMALGRTSDDLGTSCAYIDMFLYGRDTSFLSALVMCKCHVNTNLYVNFKKVFLALTFLYLSSKFFFVYLFHYLINIILSNQTIHLIRHTDKISIVRYISLIITRSTSRNTRGL